MRCSACFLADVGLGLEAARVEFGERRRSRASSMQRALEAREGLDRARIGGERGAEERLRAVDALFGILEAILRQRAGDEEIARLGAVARAAPDRRARRRARRAPNRCAVSAKSVRPTSAGTCDGKRSMAAS